MKIGRLFKAVSAVILAVFVAGGVILAVPGESFAAPTRGANNAAGDADENNGSSSGGDCPDGQVKTSILGNGGCYEPGKDGEGIFNILAIVLNVLTAGVGVAGVLGIVISGIQYMTASGNEAQMTKAKNRIVQVVIGLVMYGLFWALLEWLLPGGVL